MQLLAAQEYKLLGGVSVLARQCAGGVVFAQDRVLLLKNEKGEWVLPKGVIRNGQIANEVALERVKAEAGVKARIIAPAGETSYEFYSITRRQPVCNHIVWFLMEAVSDDFAVCEEKFQDGGFYPIEEALEMITYSQDKSLVRVSYQKYRDISA